jgi:small ligand-binding sensory domain FIST
MQDAHGVVERWSEGFDEIGLQQWAAGVRARLTAARVTLGLVFMTPPFFDQAGQVLEILRLHARIPLLIGCSSQGLIARGEEFEEAAGLVLGLYALPEAELRAHAFTQQQVEQAAEPGDWHRLTGVTPAQTNGWLVFADPFHLDSEAWLRSWNVAYAPKPILGGLAGGDPGAARSQVYLNGEVFEAGGVALSVGGGVRLESVISQGCTPIGETWTITKTDQNVIYEIANKPAYDVLLATFSALPASEQEKCRGNLFIGLVTNEYLEEFHRGDFLIRNLIGVDPRNGAIAVGAWPRPGQTVQFQRRDAQTATDDLAAVLDRAHRGLGTTPVYGGVLCSCNGRGQHLFGRPNHDAQLVQQRLGPLGVTGFFCNGEIGPVGDKNFLHGYTASLALFAKHEAGPG